MNNRGYIMKYEKYMYSSLQKDLFNTHEKQIQETDNIASDILKELSNIEFSMKNKQCFDESRLSKLQDNISDMSILSSPLYSYFKGKLDYYKKRKKFCVR